MTDLIEQVARAMKPELFRHESDWERAAAAVKVLSDRVIELEAENARLIADRAQWVEPERLVVGKQND